MVDWIGLSVFGAQLPTHEEIGFGEKLSAKYGEVVALSRQKPILISEYAVIEQASNPNAKALWLQEALESLVENKYPRIKGASYWHSPGWLPGGKASFRFDSSPAALEEYRSQLARPGWLSKGVFGPR
jgi:hypothetical protein